MAKMQSSCAISFVRNSYLPPKTPITTTSSFVKFALKRTTKSERKGERKYRKKWEERKVYIKGS